MTTCYFIKYKCDESFKQITWYDARNFTRNKPRYTVIDDKAIYYCYDDYVIKSKRDRWSGQ